MLISQSDVLKGVEWATEATISELKAAKKNKSKHYKGSVANMSLGGGMSRALNEAVNAAVEEGLHFAVAAGNDNADACNYSPAAAENAVTVRNNEYETYLRLEHLPSQMSVLTSPTLAGVLTYLPLG